MALWYPVAAPCPHPLLLYSHGFMPSRSGGRYLAEHLASYGYVVAAADFPLSHWGTPGGPNANDVVNQPGDVSFLIDRVLALSAGARPFEGEIDPQEIGAFGLSMGGLTTSLVTFHPTWRDARIRAALSIAGPGANFTARFYDHADLPFLMIGGTADAMIDYEQNAAPVPARIRHGGLVTIEHATHAGFDDMAGGVLRVFGNMDRLDCRTLLANLHVDAGRRSPFMDLGTPEMGVTPFDPESGMPCQRQFEDAMSAGLQHQLTTTASSPTIPPSARRPSSSSHRRCRASAPTCTTRPPTPRRRRPRRRPERVELGDALRAQRVRISRVAGERLSVKKWMPGTPPREQLLALRGRPRDADRGDRVGVAVDAVELLGEASGIRLRFIAAMRLFPATIGTATPAARARST